MQITGDVKEPVPCDAVCDGRVVEGRMKAPVVLQSWQMVYGHHDTESKVCPEFTSFTHNQPRILIGLSHDAVYKLVSEEEVEDVNRPFWDIHRWTNSLLERLNGDGSQR